jgi:hypothetical protein
MKQSVILVSTAAFVMLLIAALLIFGPIFVIWSLNTLFPVLVIPYTIETWVSVVILAWALKVRVNIKMD